MSTSKSTQHNEDNATRRDFIHIAATGIGAVGAGVAVWPFIHQMNPAADTLALSSVELDLSGIAEGESIVIKWRKKPVFIRHRTPQEIKQARAVNLSDLPDSQPDDARVIAGKDQWLIVVGVCTHLGCVPLGTKVGEDRGEYGGWFCPCHGSHYDTSGRIRKGPAPENLTVPEFAFINDSIVKIG